MRRRIKENTDNPLQKTENEPKKERLHNTSQWPQERTAWCSASTLASFAVLALGASMVVFNTHQLQALHQEQLRALEKVVASSVQSKSPSQSDRRPVAMVWSPRVNLRHLQHVIEVLERFGYKIAEDNSSNWDVLWAHDYPFHAWNQALREMQPHQKVNHFPGTGYVTTKVSLATSGGPFIPPAFRIPQDKEKLLEYAASHPDVLFVEKSNDHRSVQVRALSEIDFESSGSFVQEFRAQPLLVSGHKFDIGVYTIITSMDPLRIYKYDGDVLFRFCLEPYEPLNTSNIAQYVIGEDYLPAWEVPALKPYSDLSYSRKEAFDAYLRTSGQDPSRVWEQVDAAITSVYLSKEKLFIDLLKRYNSRHSFFEMVRFDFIIDDDLTVHLLEANMSPNLSSAHYPPNALMYEQVINSLLPLVGVASYLHPPHPQSRATRDMVAADRNLMVFPEHCATCQGCEEKQCQLCRPCLHPDTLADLRLAYLEHVNRQACKRIFPPPMTQEVARTGLPILHSNLTEKNDLMVRWFQGKCLLNSAWCQ